MIFAVETILVVLTVGDQLHRVDAQRCRDLVRESIKVPRESAMKYFDAWVRSSDKKDPFDDYVIVHSSPIGTAELALAQTHLRNSDEHVVTDDAMAFVVYLDLELKDNPDIRSEIKNKSFERLRAAAKKA